VKGRGRDDANANRFSPMSLNQKERRVGTGTVWRVAALLGQEQGAGPRTRLARPVGERPEGKTREDCEPHCTGENKASLDR